MYKKEYILQCTNDREGNVDGCQLIAKIQKEMLSTIKLEAFQVLKFLFLT
jgi:hypothetical protein